MRQKQEMISFVLRLVRDTSPVQPPRWRGMIQHVQSSHRRNFTQLGEALQFIQEQIGKEVDQDATNGSELLTEDARLWGQYATKYQDLVFQAWLETIASPSSIQKAIADTLQAWHLPDRRQQEEAIQSLEALKRRLVDLTRQIENVEAGMVATSKESTAIA
jgi:hypothetical protein